MAKQSRKGNALYLEFDGVEIGVDFRSFDAGFDAQTVDNTAGDDALVSEFVIREMIKPTAQILVQDDATGQTIAAKLKQGVTGNLVWGPEGNASGKPKWGIEAEVKKSNIPFAHDGEQVFDVEWINTGRVLLFDGRTDTF